MRVKVLNGDGTQELGFGEYVGDVGVYVTNMPGVIQSMTMAEEPIPPELLQGRQQHFIPNNPKIVLDSGEVVYGCQVWWEPVDGPQ